MRSDSGRLQYSISKTGSMRCKFLSQGNRMGRFVQWAKKSMMHNLFSKLFLLNVAIFICQRRGQTGAEILILHPMLCCRNNGSHFLSRRVAMLMAHDSAQPTRHDKNPVAVIMKSNWRFNIVCQCRSRKSTAY